MDELNACFDDSRTPEYVVAIGASAGGLDGIKTFFEYAMYNSKFCIILAQHLSDTHKSYMFEILQNKTNVYFED